FTPDIEQCATEAFTSITVHPTSATFSQVDPICEGTPIILPSTSNNGVTGNWELTLDNPTNKTYTFTPDAGQCTPVTATETMTIVVNQKTTPIFTIINTLCSGETNPILPLISDNGINGTWNP